MSFWASQRTDQDRCCIQKRRLSGEHLLRKMHDSLSGARNGEDEPGISC